MNAIEFLIKEHNRVRKMLLEISEDSHHFDKQKKKFFDLSQDLIRHETMEQKIWYPHFKNRLSQEVKHLLTEEKHAEKAIEKLNGIQNEEAWEEAFSKFKDTVEHHAEEEEHDLFPEVKRVLSEKELEKIGAEMEQFKLNYMVIH